jgi:spermidine synthase
VKTHSARSGFNLIFLCFFLSGATGLIYQVIWLRMLGLIFGHSVYAITTVLAAFMAGLALGSLLLARQTPRIRNLIAAYGWLEIAIGLSCALIPVLLWGAAALYLFLHAALQLSYDAFSLVQFLLIFLLLLIPTTLMGGTLPVLSQALVTQDVGLGRKVGTLYAINTFGGVVGVILAGYVLLPALGNYWTIAVAVSGNLAVGLLALVLSRRPSLAAMTAGTADTPRVPAQTAPVSLSAARLTVLALGVSGAVSMIYEVGWTRAIALVIGSSTYAFTAMLVAFLVGIAGGSALYSWLMGTRRPSVTAFALLQAGIAAASAVTLLFFERTPELFLYLFASLATASFIPLVHFVVSAASLLPFTLLIGATFPCAVALVAHQATRVGRDVGEIYAVNTLGCIVGSVAGGFLLIPAAGVNMTIKVGIAVNLLLAAVLFAPLLSAGARGSLARQCSRWGLVMATLGAAAAALLLPAWNPSVMSSGPAVYAGTYLKAAKGSTLRDVLRKQEILFYRDGRSGTVSVERIGEHINLRVNGKYDAGTSGDMPTQLMSGHLPLLLHRDPRRVLVIGMGSGVTAGAVLRHPVKQLDIVEIEPAVLEASRFFAGIHGDVLHNPRTRAIVADGRNYLLTTPERYDVIISEPSNPWIAGLASLFSAEFFQLVRERLQPGGVMLQWLQGYNLFSDDFRMIVQTFRSAFPFVTIWNTTAGDYLLVGSLDPAPIDLLRMKERYDHIAGVREELQQRLNHMGWAAPLGYFMLSDEGAARFAEGAGLNTDAHLPLEFSAPRALYSDTAGDNWSLVRSYQAALVPPVTAESEAELTQASVWYSLAMVQLERGRWLAGCYVDALAAFEAALERQPGFAAAQVGAAWAALKLGNPDRALTLAQAAAERAPQDRNAHYVAGMAAEKLGRYPDMVAHLERAMAQRSDEQSSRTYFNRLVLQFNLGLAYAGARRYPEAEAAFRQAIALSPDDAYHAYSSLSRLLIEVGRMEEAVSAAEESIRHDPTYLWAHFNRAWALENLGRFHEAAAGYETTLKIEPSLEEARKRLLAIQARPDKA